MTIPFMTVLLSFIGLAFIALLSWVYLRSRQGDQRAIGAINSLLLPMFSLIICISSLLIHNRKNTPSCSSTVNPVANTGIVLAIALILCGCLYFSISRDRDRRKITHAVLLAIIILTITVLYTYLRGCL
jgi:cell division protein FtsW (lipid II flippase)